MKIYIPTYGRVDRQVTLDNMPDFYRDKTTLVVYEDEAEQHTSKGRDVMVIPAAYPRGIGNKRNFILSNTDYDRVIMLDDDLVFAARREDEPTKFRPMEERDWDLMMASIGHAFTEGYVHGAIAMREGGNRRTEAHYHNSRALRAHFVRRDMPTRYRDGFMEDFHMTLSLLTSGFPNVILNRWVQNQSGSNSKGGCSDTRSLEEQAAAAHSLAASYPDFVKVVEKETKTAWGGTTRTDVRIQWKKAIESANK